MGKALLVLAAEWVVGVVLITTLFTVFDHAPGWTALLLLLPGLCFWAEERFGR